MIEKIRLCSFLLALTFLTTHCNKNQEEDPNPVEEDSTCYTTMEVFTNSSTGYILTREFVYENDHLVVINETANQPTTNTLTLVVEYDASGRVSRTNILDKGNLIQYYTYEYDNQNLLRKINLFADYRRTGTLSLNFSRELQYNAQNQIISSKSYRMLTQVPFLINDAAYTYDDKGNVTNVREYRVLSFSLRTEPEILADIMVNMRYTHDDKINPHYRLLYTNPNSLISTLSKNNSITVISETTLEGTKKGPGTFDMSSINYSRTFTHTYSNKDWPLKRMGTDGTSTTYKYICK